MIIIILREYAKKENIPNILLEIFKVTNNENHRVKILEVFEILVLHP